MVFNDVDGSVYHETLTLALLLTVNHFMHVSRSIICFNGNNNNNNNELLLDKKLKYTLYSEELLDSDSTGKEYFETDLDIAPCLKLVYLYLLQY